MSRRKSMRELEAEIDDLQGHASTDGDSDEVRERYVAEARERWEADEYEPGSFDHVLDAYTLDLDTEAPHVDALFTTITLDVGGLHSWEPIKELPPYDESPEPPTLPPVPTEDVADALEAYGVANGVDAPALRRRHPDDWVEHLMADLYFERRRQRIKASAAEWNDERRRRTQARIERWREALHAGEWPGSVEDGKWRVRPLEEYL